VTQKTQPNGGMTFYLHVWNWPADGKILLPGIRQRAHSGRMLASHAKISSTVTGEGLLVTLPGSAPDPDVSVAMLKFDRPVEITLAPQP